MKKYLDNILIALVIAIVYLHTINQNNHENIRKPTTPTVVVPDDIKPDNACDLALTNAYVQNKNLLIIFGADWCGFCRSLKQDMLNIKNIDKYEACFIDIDNKLNTDIVKHFNLQSVPTSVIVDPKSNKEIKRNVGYIKNDYENWLGR